MANTHETIADIIAAKRRLAAEMEKALGDQHASVEMLKDDADRIEAAHRRELSKNVSKNGADFGQLGGAAKLREACANIAEYARSAQCHTEDAHVLGYLNQIEGWAQAALAAPARNCDRPECATSKAAQDVWRKEDGGRTAYYEWLLATYKKGDNNGNE